jgi:hypothetical protein
LRLALHFEQNKSLERDWFQALPGGRSGIIGLGKRKTGAAIRILLLSTGNKKDAMRFCCGN